MRAYKTNRDRPNRIESAIVTADTRTLEPKLVGLLNLSSRHGQHRRLVRSRQTPPRQRNQVVGLPASIDGLPSLVHHLVQDVLAELQSDEVARDADIRSLLPITLEKMADRMRGLAPRRNAEPGPPSAAVELISSVDPSAQKRRCVSGLSSSISSIGPQGAATGRSTCGRGSSCCSNTWCNGATNC